MTPRISSLCKAAQMETSKGQWSSMENPAALFLVWDGDWKKRGQGMLFINFQSSIGAKCLTFVTKLKENKVFM